MNKKIYFAFCILVALTTTVSSNIMAFAEEAEDPSEQVASEDKNSANIIEPQIINGDDTTVIPGTEDTNE